MVYKSCHSFLQGKLTDGTVFDSSFERGDPIEFELGSGQVIKGLCALTTTHCFLQKLRQCFNLLYSWIVGCYIAWGSLMLEQKMIFAGWDQGLLGMCVGEKRKLKIPAKLGYGAQGSPPTIPGKSFLSVILLWGIELF